MSAANTEWVNWAKAAEEIIGEVNDELKGDHGIHLETCLSALGSLAGTYLLRYLAPESITAVPGMPCLNDKVDEAGPGLINAMETFAAAAEIPGEWLKSIPKENMPHVPIHFDGAIHWSRTFEKKVSAILADHEIAPKDHSMVLLFTSMLMLASGRKIVPPEAGKAIIIHSMVFGAKTTPATLN